MIKTALRIAFALLLFACGDQRSYQEKSDTIFATFGAKVTPGATHAPTRVPLPCPTPARCEQFAVASKMLACQATAEAAQQEYRATAEVP